jgi:hypothetical protein
MLLEGVAMRVQAVTMSVNVLTCMGHVTLGCTHTDEYPGELAHEDEGKDGLNDEFSTHYFLPT